MPINRLLLSFLLSALTLFLLACAANRADVAAAQATEHPRLFFRAADLPTLRERARTTHRAIWQPIVDYADTQLGTSPPAAAPSQGDLDTYRNYGNQLVALAFACVITDDESHCNVAKGHLLTYATWEQWGESRHRDLGHAHMLLGNTLAYDWLYPQLSIAERQTVQRALVRWADALHAASLGPKVAAWNNWWYKSYIQNHYVINNSVLGMAGLALMGEVDAASRWYEQAVTEANRAKFLLNGIGDGSWHEGISYQDYMLSMAVPFWLNARTLQGQDLLPHTYLQEYSTWRLYNYLPGTNRYIMAHGNFEWDYLSSRSQHLVHFVATEYQNQQAQWLGQQLLAVEPRDADIWSMPWLIFEFFYFSPALAATPPAGLPLGQTFADLAGVIWRSGWGRDDLVFGFKSGAYGGRFAFDTFAARTAPWESNCASAGCRFNLGHDHEDTNGFYLFGNGRWLAPEVVGNRENETRYHNTLLIDGQGQMRPEYESSSGPGPLEDTDGKLLTVTDTAALAHLAADATQRYRQITDIEEVSRHVVFVRPDYFLMVDQLAAGQPHRYEWISHFEQSATLDGQWIRGHAEADQILGIGVVHPQPFVATLGEHNGLPYVRIRPESPTADLRLVNLLYPTTGSAWEERPTIMESIDSGQALLLQLQHNGGAQWRDDLLLTYAQAGTAQTVGSYRYDGHTALIRRHANGEWASVALIGGSALEESGTGLRLVGLNPAEPLLLDRAQCPTEAQEAEQGLLSGSFAIGHDAAASGGAYIHSVAASNYDGPSLEDRALFCFTVDEPGRYTIQGWVFGASDLNDSFFVQVDGLPTAGYTWDVLQNQQYAADQVSDRGGDDPVVVELAAGTHLIAVALRESGTRLDRIALEAVTPVTTPASTEQEHGTYLPLILR